MAPHAIRTIGTASLLLLCASVAGPAHAQCLLANPSFEILGESGETFAGWFDLGETDVSVQATHGHRSASVRGPNTGQLGVSGYLQALPFAPGEQWRASVRGWHTSSLPHSGVSYAIPDIEWHDSGGGLIDYESVELMLALAQKVRAS